MLMKILLGGVTASLLTGQYFYQQEKKNEDLFNRMEKCPTFDFDYIQSLDELPINKEVALCAEIDKDSSKLKPAQFNPKKKVIFSTIARMMNAKEKKVTKESLQNENEAFDEFFVNIKNPEIPNFYLRNVRQEKIEVIWDNTLNKEIGFFNVKPLSYDLDPSQIPTFKQGSLKEKVDSFLNPNAKLAEIGIEHDEKYMYIGELQKADAGRLKEGIHFTFRPKYVLGESRDFFLRYADGQVVKFHNKAKRYFIIATALTFSHVVITYSPRIISLFGF